DRASLEKRHEDSASSLPGKLTSERAALIRQDHGLLTSAFPTLATFRTEIRGPTEEEAMNISTRWIRLAALAAAVTITAGAAKGEDQQILITAPKANPKAAGVSAPSVLIHGLGQTIHAQGSMVIENGTAAIPYYGYYGNGPMVPAPGDVQTSTHAVEASKSEPDKNTYLVLQGLSGPS